VAVRATEWTPPPAAEPVDNNDDLAGYDRTISSDSGIDTTACHSAGIDVAGDEEPANDDNFDERL